MCRQTLWAIRVNLGTGTCSKRGSWVAQLHVTHSRTVTEKSRLASLFEAYGIGSKVSLREAAKRAGVSRQTLSGIMRPGEQAGASNVRQQREASLRKIANAFGIPFDHVKTAAMADWGQIKTVDAASVQAVYALVEKWHPDELVHFQTLITGLLGAMASGRRPQNGGAQPDRPQSDDDG